MEIGHITEIPLNFSAVQFINRTSDNYQNRNFEKNNSFILLNILLLCSQVPFTKQCTVKKFDKFSSWKPVQN